MFWADLKHKNLWLLSIESVTDAPVVVLTKWNILNSWSMVVLSFHEAGVDLVEVLHCVGQDLQRYVPQKQHSLRLRAVWPKPKKKDL